MYILKRTTKSELPIVVFVAESNGCEVLSIDLKKRITEVRKVTWSHFKAVTGPKSNWPARPLQGREEESLDKKHANPVRISGCLRLISSHIKWTNWTQAGQATGNQNRFYFRLSETSLHHNISDQAVAFDRWCSKLTVQDSVARRKVMDLNVKKNNNQTISI